jgi:phosphatidylglycerophosphate synthase
MNKVPSIEVLKTMCRKPKELDKAYIWYVTRKISVYFTWVFLHYPVTPTMITISGIALYLIGSVLLAFNLGWLNVLAIIFFELGMILDCVDGEVARYKKEYSWFGVYVDMLGHFIVKPAIFVGLTLNVYNYYHYPQVLILGLWGLLFIPEYEQLAQFEWVVRRIEKNFCKDRKIIVMFDKDEGPPELMAKMAAQKEAVSAKTNSRKGIKALVSAKENLTENLLHNLVTASVLLDLILGEFFPYRMLCALFFVYAVPVSISKIIRLTMKLSAQKLETEYNRLVSNINLAINNSEQSKEI